MAQGEDAATALGRLETETRDLEAAATGEAEARRAAEYQLAAAAQAAANCETRLGELTERIAADDAADVRALKGWRYEIFGHDALRLKSGELAIALDEGSINLIPRPGPGAS